MAIDKHHQLQMLEILETDPEITQADLAARVGVAVGTVNWYLKRWSTKGLIIIKRKDRWRWRYLLTPQGVAEKTRLATKYIQASLNIYRRARAESKHILEQVLEAGHTQVVIDGQGEIPEICALTCLEMDVKVVSEADGLLLPVVSLNGTRLKLDWQVPTEDSELRSRTKPDKNH